MDKIFSGLIAQFSQFYKSLGPIKRMVVIAAMLIVTISVGSVIFVVSGKDYAPLFTNLPSEQITVMMEKLNQKNIPFRLGDDGKTILVPREVVPAAQMTLMSELASPKMGSIGLEMFDKQDFGVNSYAQKINFQRALQGELMRAINTLSSVKQSKVILALPNKKTFLEEGGKASASVVLELHPGKELTAEQVRGVRYLVANSVEGLDPDRVTVLDERGKVLTRQSDGALGQSSEILELKQKVEGELENRVETILSKVVGHTKIVAKVNATLNHRVVTAIEESIDPDSVVVKSSQTEEESLDGARTSPTGVPGSRSNIPGAEDNNGSVGFKQDVKKEMKTTNYEVPKTVKNIKEAAGNIEKLSVAVLVDGITTQVKKEDGTFETKWQPRSPEEMAKYESLVKNAIGFNTARGDTVKIESIQFQNEDFAESDSLLINLERKKLLHALFKWALLGFSLALLFFIVVRPFMQWITDSFQDSVDDMLPRTIEELEELQTVDGALPGMGNALPILSDSVDPEKAETELLRDRIMGLMQKDEDKAAGAFGMWLVRKDM